MIVIHGTPIEAKQCKEDLINVEPSSDNTEPSLELIRRSNSDPTISMIVDHKISIEDGQYKKDLIDVKLLSEPIESSNNDQVLKEENSNNPTLYNKRYNKSTQLLVNDELNLKQCEELKWFCIKTAFKFLWRIILSVFLTAAIIFAIPTVVMFCVTPHLSTVVKLSPVIAFGFTIISLILYFCIKSEIFPSCRRREVEI
jgi:hypothetical protein